MQQLDEAERQKGMLILACRKRACLYDTLKFQEKRQNFLDWLSVNNWSPPVYSLEMYEQPEDEPLKSPANIYQYFNRWHNTRTKLLSETCWETDKLQFEKAIAICCEICLALIRKYIHFAVFYAEGQRSPHIRIYDFSELRELTPFQREKAQAKFWRSLAPFFFQLADASMWADEHYYCLEFAPHWKYGTVFDLVFEWLPEEKCSS